MEAQEMQGMLDRFEHRLMSEVRQEFANVRQEMAAGFADVRRESAEAHSETRRYFDVVAESLRADIRGVAEGVVGCNQRVDRLEAEMKIEFADVRDLIDVSYRALDQRVSRLENL